MISNFFWRVYEVLFGLVLVISVFGVMYIALLAGPVIRDRLSSNHVSENACTPKDWRERAKCYHPPGECMPKDWRERAKCYKS